MTFEHGNLDPIHCHVKKRRPPLGPAEAKVLTNSVGKSTSLSFREIITQCRDLAWNVVQLIDQHRQDAE